MQLWQVTDWWRSRVGRRTRRILNRLRGTRTATFLPGPVLDDLGSPVRALTITTGVLTELPDGTLVGCAAPQGTDAALNVCAASDGTRLLTMPTSQTAGVTAMVTAADSSVVLGGYHGGQLFRWVPGTEQVDLLGRASPRADFVYGLSAASDGRVFGGSYPDASFFSWTPQDGVRVLGRIRDRAISYVRATATDGHTLWLGTMPEPRLYRYDMGGGDLTQVDLDAPADASGVMALTQAGDLVFAQVSGALRVVDATTGALVRLESAPQRELQVSSPVFVTDHHARVWFTTRDQDGRHRLAVADPHLRALRITDHVVAAGPLIGGGTDEHGIVHGFAGNYSGAGVRFDPDEVLGSSGGNQLTSTQWDLEPAPAALCQVLADPDRDRAFVSAYVNGATAQVDLTTGTAEPLPRLGQVESWTMVEGKLWAGSYPNGAITVLDPDHAASATNPEVVATLKDACHQIRPVSVTRLGDDLWWACVPDYGQRGGALVRVGIEPGPDRVSWWRHLVPDHALSVVVADQAGLAAGSTARGLPAAAGLWVGTSRLDGTLVTATGGSARLVQVDPARAEVVASIAPVPGATTITAITIDRSPARSDRLLVLADDTVLAIELHPSGLGRVLARRWLDVPNCVVPGSGSIVVTQDAIVVALGERLMELHPVSLEPLLVSAGVSRRLVRARDGDLLSVVASGSHASPARVGRWRARPAGQE